MFGLWRMMSRVPFRRSPCVGDGMFDEGGGLSMAWCGRGKIKKLRFGRAGAFDVR